MAVTDKSPINISFRVWLSLVTAFTCFFILILRLWYLQIIQGEYFRDRSENNRIRTIYIPAPRGLIKDRNDEVIVRNRPSFNIDFVSEDSPDPEGTLKHLAEISGASFEELKERFENQKKRRRFEPKLLLKDISRDLVGKISARKMELPGVTVNAVPAREYIYGDMAAHVLGYIREINSSQLKDPEYATYRSGDIVGQYGVEARWERYLRGERGNQAVVVNASGMKIAEAYFESEKPGHNITLTIDRKVQAAADKALEGKKGAIVAMDTRTGEILALASAPRFDPNIFTGELTSEVWRDLTEGKEHKMNNRALQGAFPPGSVFKIFVAIATLSEEVASLNQTIFCPGFLQFGRRPFRCHKHSGHGPVDLYSSIVQSCDVYYYTVGQRLGVDMISDYAKRFGLGEVTNLGLVKENPGLVPSTAWKAAYFKDPEEKKWYPGETLSVAIGQGAVTATPLQIVRAIAAVVNGGKVLEPRIVKKIESIDGRILDEPEGPKITREVDIRPEILEQVKKAMIGVVNDPRGTGHRAQLPKELNILVGGKTGTSQVSSKEISGKEGEDHAWFAGFAPADNPEIAVVALVENGGHGGAAAAPLVNEVMQAYFGYDPKAASDANKGNGGAGTGADSD